MSPTDAPLRRRADAGVTLVEVLVVLALVGAAAGAVGLGLGPAARRADARGEAALLAARMRLASEEALLTGRPAALLWSEAGYRFVALADGAWAPHPLPLLGEPKALAAGLRVEEAPGAWGVTPAALPLDGAPLVLRIGGDGGGAAAVAWDGATATVAEGEP